MVDIVADFAAFCRPFEVAYKLPSRCLRQQQEQQEENEGMEEEVKKEEKAEQQATQRSVLI